MTFSLIATGKTPIKIFHSVAIIALLSLSVYAKAEPTARARGAILFMNYCSGCHSLKYLPWSRMVNDLDLVQEHSVQINPHLRLSTASFATIWPKTAMATHDAQQWFGKPPPDLSLITRQRGSNWVNAYLQGFYPDPNRRFGVNNHYLPNAMMPNVLESLPDQATAIADIITFLDYAAEPAVLQRTPLGGFVVGFLLILCLLFWLRMRIM